MTAQLIASTTLVGTGTTAPDGRGLARGAWRRIGEAIREMNYAASRLAGTDITWR
jgi:hypothetical protein